MSVEVFLFLILFALIALCGIVYYCTVAVRENLFEIIDMLKDIRDKK